MQATVSWQQGVLFKGSSGDHQVLMEGPDSYGGQNRGFRPMQLLLTGLGGCTSFDVITTLEKMRQNVTDCQVMLDAERSDEVPAVFTQIHIHFSVKGKGLKEAMVKRAVALSAEKYCSASIMLTRAGVDITHSFVIIDDSDV